MEQQLSTQSQQTPRQPWEEPRIVLERPLEVRGQGGLPGGEPANPLAGFLGPLSASGGGAC